MWSKAELGKIQRFRVLCVDQFRNLILTSRRANVFENAVAAHSSLPQGIMYEEIPFLQDFNVTLVVHIIFTGHTDCQAIFRQNLKKTLHCPPTVRFEAELLWAS
ncbi:hypothetical protein BDQ94DRAFT_140231 [Aspergillus welwitschiae]|uniref:Uncharacterized protein n=1 Tax=Aspergillus welwitschiae TaxID=1341132 RepID=A0A3F3Q7F3_9EURO|nr:hypothetical protein BDQ94DRAFT_140231 [Aspergillus welwitschiae]RDH35108.1 hypothetical protein BDQ94DRAFT_140231 [Aspergillus welwitschiae]